MMGTDRTWERKKARQKRNGGKLDLMMKVLSAPPCNGFSVSAREMDGWFGDCVEVGCYRYGVLVGFSPAVSFFIKKL